MIENKFTMVELFSGIGAQERALRQLGIPYEIKNTCDCDKETVLSYAAMRYDLEKEIKVFNFPSKETMVEELQAKNLGYDFEKSKHTITMKTNIDKVKQYYIADKLSKNLGDIGKVERLPYADMVTYSFPCFIPGTMVLTDKGFKNIEDIETGEMVLTHTNQYQKVIKPMKNYCNTQVYKINAMCSDPIYTTEEHPFYVRKRHRVWENSRRTYKRIFDAPEWIKAKDLTKDYYVGIAINQKSEIPKWDGMTFHWSDGRKDRHSNKIGQYMDKKDFWWIIGRYIGDGWLVDGYGKNPSYGIKICCAYDETSEITDVLDKLDIHYVVEKASTVNRITLSLKELYHFCLQFGRGAANKRLTNTIIDLPVDLLESFLNGYMSADGCVINGNTQATSVSKELIYGLTQCVAKVYRRAGSVSKYNRPKTCVIEGRTVNQKDTYMIRYHIEQRKQDNAFYENGYIWCPISGIDIEDYDGYVYNMEVENDNSYVVQNIIVHNCTDLSVAGKGEGMVNKCECGHTWDIDFSDANNDVCRVCGKRVQKSTRSGLLGQVQRLISVAQEENTLPKYLLMENVKNLIGKKFKPQFDSWVAWLDSIGYNTYYKVLNAKHYGIPQNRERVFAMSVRKDIDINGYTFPEQIPLTYRLKDMLEQNVDEKYYLPDERIEKILSSMLTRGFENLKSVQPEIIVHNIPQTVRVRVYPVDTPKLVATLKEHKTLCGFTNKTLAEAMNLPLTMVEHWFRTDDCFAIPDPTVWFDLKTLLKINTDEFDQSIMTFEERDGVYEKAQRVYDSDGIAATLTCAESDMKVLVEESQEPFIVASRGRNPENPSVRTVGLPTEQRLEPNFSGCTNTLTSVQKDNYVCEPQVVIGSMQANAYVGDGTISPSLTAAMGMGGGQIPMVGYVEPQVLRAERTEYGKAIRKQYEAGEVDEKIGNMREMKPRTDGISNTITTVQKDNFVVEPIVYDDYNSRISADQDAINTLTCNCGASAERNGVKIIEPVVVDAIYNNRPARIYDEAAPTLRSERFGLEVIEPKDLPCSTRGSQVASTIRASIYKQGARNLVENVINNRGYEGVIESGEPRIKWRIRKLTPKECLRLMGFTDKDADRSAQFVSASAQYKQAGNSICTSVLIALFSSLLLEDGHKADVWSKHLIHYSDKN